MRYATEICATTFPSRHLLAPGRCVSDAPGPVAIGLQYCRSNSSTLARYQDVIVESPGSPESDE